MVEYHCRQFSLNGHLYKTDTLLKWTPRVGPCLSLVLLIDSLNPLSPNIHIQILQTDLHTFPS